MINSGFANVIKFKKLTNSSNSSPIQEVEKIQQDEDGFIWIATADSGLFKYNGNKLKSIKVQADSSPIEILTMEIGVHNNIWIGTKQNGLIRYNNGQIKHYKKDENVKNSISSNTVNTLLNDSKNGLWIGTSDGLSHLSKAGIFKHYKLTNKSKQLSIRSLLIQDDRMLLIGTSTGLYALDLKTDDIIKYKLDKNNPKLSVFSIHIDHHDSLWIGTRKGLYQWDVSKQEFKAFMPGQLNMIVYTITSEKNNMWIGTFYHGLYKYSYATQELINYKYDPHSMDSISDNIILWLSVDQSNVLWIGTYNNGINYVDISSLNFGLENDSTNSIYCSDNNTFYGFLEDSENNMWISSQNGLIKYNKNKNLCEFYGNSDIKQQNFSHKFIYTVSEADDEHLWVPTIRGLNLFNKISKKVDKLENNTPRTRTYFAKKHDKNHVIIGTNRGLYKYSIKNKISVELKPINHGEQKLDFAGYDTLNKNKANESILLFGQSGVFKLDQNETLKQLNSIQEQLPTKDIRSIYVDGNDVFIGTSKYGLFQFNQDHQLVTRFTQEQGVPINSTINSIEKDNKNNLWLGSGFGLIRLNITTKQSHTFYEGDGLQSNYFQKSSSLKTSSGKLIFGGRNGFNAFYPEKININEKAPKIVLTDFLRFGQSVETDKNYDGFKLNNDINKIDELILSHKDYVVGFEFAALDFADPKRNKYAFKMEGQDPNWNHVDAYNRSISYSNLKPGSYIFKVKGANKDGTWNKKGKTLKIKVLPAPWLSWWAWLSYIMTSIIALWWYVRSRTRANEKTTQLLRVEVEKKTKILQQKTNELQIQKQTVESLLIRKNELFANISHEFRTPLTLIIGPVQQLLKKSIHTSDMNTLKMINRNANRLLTMIEQLLQLAKISDGEKIVFKCYKTQTHIQTIVDSFKSMASEKKIDLNLLQNDQAAIKVTENSIEIILGNLLSNAIKYTPINGKVTVVSEVSMDKINIKVKDTGPGLDSEQQIEIFSRFKRLNPNQNISGVGIGLSVVDEMLRVNNARIKIDSELGKGSAFIVTFDTISLEFNEEKSDPNQLLMNQLALDTVTDSLTTDTDTFVGNKTSETILIIDDNHDMRQHIANTLKDNYYCMLAAEGRDGIAMAIKHIPDVIICDVMMPVMDGFEVSRVLRSDSRTSHIPLVMLTALNDKASRIRGWREHVDVYVTKPFDANELTVQLENILVIRNILKQKAGSQISEGKNSSNLDLPELDQKFVEKLNKVIKNNFHNASYLRPQMASDMAVSIKQLQRKLKALIDKNPMDLLRDYRLSQAAIQLKSGYQVSIISDNCGFNSVSYFSQCFKAQYGLSPKKYQQICHDKRTNKT